MPNLYSSPLERYRQWAKTPTGSPTLDRLVGPLLSPQIGLGANPMAMVGDAPGPLAEGLRRLIESPLGRRFAIPDAPVPEGMTRLFRGEGPRTAAELTHLDAARAALQGRWFTRNPTIASVYAEMGGPAGQILSVDVPQAIAQASRVAGNPALERLAAGLGQIGEEHVLPLEWALKALAAQP